MRILLLTGLLLMSRTGIGQVHSRPSPLFMANDTLTSDSSAFTHYDNGGVRYRNDFTKGERIRTVYFDTLGQRRFDLRYRDGKQHGLGVEWYADGRVKSLSTYDLGSGFYTEYYPNGSVGALREYEDGKWVGEYTEWWPNGMLKYRIHRDSTRQVARSFHANGTLASEGVLLDGEAPVGPWKQWYDTGVLKSVGSWRDIRAVPSRNSPSLKCGEWVYYTSTGEQESTEQHDPCPPN